MAEQRDAPYPELKRSHTMAHTGRPWTDHKPPPAAPVWAAIQGLGSYYVALAAIELDVFDTLAAAGPSTVDVLAKRLEVSEPHLRALLDWAGADASTLPPDRLRGFSYASKVKVTPIALEVQDINIRLDASTMTGGLAVALRERPGFGLRLAIDQLNLDAYLPRTSRQKDEHKFSSAYFILDNIVLNSFKV